MWRVPEKGSAVLQRLPHTGKEVQVSDRFLRAVLVSKSFKEEEGLRLRLW
jgi:hypothetical protein